MQLRYYQEEAVLSIYDYFQQFTGNPIVALPTGTGKSIVIAEFVRSVMTYFPGQRVMMLTHVKELIVQNYQEMVSVWPLAPVGIYSAGIGSREIAPITFAGIASVVKKAHLFGHVDLVLVDECHLISPHDETNYRIFIEALRAINPAVKVIGFTATPYRLGQGLLTWATTKAKGTEAEEIKPALFTDICYDLTGLVPFNRLIAEGFLAPLVPKRTETQIDISGVHMQAGEYNLAELQSAVDRSSITKKAIDEILFHGLLNNEERMRWLIFATGVDHSEHIAAEIRERGFDAHAIHSKTPASDRDLRLAEFKKPSDGKVKCLVSNNVLTTGFNAPHVDLIGMLRHTMSPGLWVQMLGRGTRPYPGKKNCLVLDFAGNTKRLGPINDPKLPKRKGEKDGGEAPVKCCEKCGTYNHASVRFCTSCGHEFPPAIKFKEKASSDELIKSSSPVVEVFAVNHITYKPWFPRNTAKPPSLYVSYYCGSRQFSEWVCLEHDGWAGKKGRDWWRRRTPDEEPPPTVEEAMKHIKELDSPTHIRVWVNQTHPEIMAHDFTGTAFGKEAKSSGKPEILDEDVPF